MRRIRMLMLAIASLACFEAHAEVTHADFRHPKNETNHSIHLVFLSGVSSGLLSYNVVLQGNHAEPLFCQPLRLGLTADQDADIMLRWAKAQTKNTDDLPMSLAMLYALEERFPCPSNRILH
jgi:hypothetical protein